MVVRVFTRLLKLAAVGLAVLAVVAFLPLAAVTFAGLIAVRSSAAPCTTTPTLVSANALAGLTVQQTANAETIIWVGQQMGVGAQGATVAIAAAMVESELLNVPFGDRDSLGLFQMRPSQGWGTPAQIMDPVYSATQFYTHLKAVSGWQQMAPGDAAQAVERSAFPAKYAARIQLASQVVATAVPGSLSPLQLTGNCIRQGRSTPASGTVGPGYINPITPGQWQGARTDQGVDWIPLNARVPVLAIGPAVVVVSTTSSGWPGGAFVVIQLTAGSHQGLFVFVAEHLTDLAPVGARLQAGQQYATALAGSPWTEWGFARGPCVCVATPYNGAPDGTPMPSGKAMARLFKELGATPLEDPGLGPDRPTQHV